MKKHDSNSNSKSHFTRRNFLASVGAATAGLLANPFRQASDLHAFSRLRISDTSAQVAVTQALDYSDPALIKQKVQHLFEAMGGIGDVVGSSDKVAIKINLTGGTSYEGNPRLAGTSLTDSVWTHPTVMRAVAELLIDHGVSPTNLYIVESIWDIASYNNYGFKEIQDDLGFQLVDLNKPAPYTEFIEKDVGEGAFFYESFTVNAILDEVDVFVSLPKMKQHEGAAVTHSMKNLVGMVPVTRYGSGWRSQLHFDGGQIGTHLPRSIVDLNLARPIHLAVIDGIKNSEGGELPMHNTFVPTEYQLLLAGKNRVALDSIASAQMGNDPEAEQFRNPGGQMSDNYLILANQVGMGTNVLSEIELVGDGAGLINTSVDQRPFKQPTTVQLYENFPNPFNGSTNIRYFVPKSDHVTLKIFNSRGREVETLVNRQVASGEHQMIWDVKSLPSGMYFVKLQAGRYQKTMKLAYQK